MTKYRHYDPCLMWAGPARPWLSEFNSADRAARRWCPDHMYKKIGTGTAGMAAVGRALPGPGLRLTKLRSCSAPCSVNLLGTAHPGLGEVQWRCPSAESESLQVGRVWQLPKANPSLRPAPYDGLKSLPTADRIWTDRHAPSFISTKPRRHRPRGHFPRIPKARTFITRTREKWKLRSCH